ncbi:MAG TPA: ATP-binding cassette domain-containing protein [Methylocella sp.]|nr:ATP-binding cassette domain-containing protein [Methylocella sp.]
MLRVRITRKTRQSASGQLRIVLEKCAFDLKPGETCALLGPSGCGKTTLLRIIAGLDCDFDGQLERPAGSRIGMVFQDPRLLPWRTVWQNLRLVGISQESDITDIAAALGLSRHLNHFPGELSLGLARRVAIARAFAVKPDLLLLDEPFVSLDPALAIRLQEELLALVHKRKAATLFVTHSIDEAVSVANRVIVLSAAPGTLIADQTVEELCGGVLHARVHRAKEAVSALLGNASTSHNGADLSL